MNSLYGIKHKKGNFIRDNRAIDYESLRVQYISDEDPDTFGYTCSSIKCAPDLQIMGAPDIYSLYGCPVYFVIDPNSVGMDSQGKQKAPIVNAIIKAGDSVLVPEPHASGDSPSAPTEGHDKNAKKGETK